MIWKAIIFSLFLLMGWVVQAAALDKAAFYSAILSGDKLEIDRELAALTDNEQGYIGALTIRKASLVPKVKDKLKLFKEGRKKLEAALLNDPDNAEFHFLRLSIQENAPAIVGYKANLKADKAFLIKHFNELSLVVQRAVKDYCQRSKILKPADFNN